MARRERFINDMKELKAIIEGNNKAGTKNGPIVLGLYSRLSKVFKHIAVVVVLAFTAALVSCGSNHYSPLDSYIKGSVESQEANVKAEREARAFIDSINCK